MSKTEFDVLQGLCDPVVKYLQDNFDPHTTVVITDDSVRLERTEMFIPIKTEDDKRQLSNVRTRELVQELKTREGVQTKCAEPYQDTQISVNGPAVILIVTD